MLRRLAFINSVYDALIVSNGQPVRRKLFDELHDRARHLIALDGGLERLRRWGVVPEHVVGDLDSVTPATLAWARTAGAKIHRRPSPDEPDVSKGMALCQWLGFRHLAVVGFTGDRPDHMLAVLDMALKATGSVELFTDELVYLPLVGSKKQIITVPQGHLISWFGYPVAEKCSLTGVRWPFRNRTLRMSGFYSLSNEPAAEEVHLSQQRGRSLLSISLNPLNLQGSIKRNENR
ncbi:MAG: thiamine diphosphokinase [bacterium]|nr:thiamine diphosphokinase [bacterium]